MAPRARTISAPAASWPRRILSLFAVMAMAVTGLFVPSPPQADAGLYNLFPADFDGFPKGQFYSDEALYVTLTSDIKGGYVCIVAAHITDPSRANCQNNYAWGTPHQYVGLGTLLGYPLAAPRLQPGKWRLLTVPSLVTEETVPVVKNAILEQMKITKPTPGTELSEVFEVVACDPCDESWARDELEVWKDTAKLLSPISASVKIQKAIATASKVDKIARGMYAGASGGLAGILLGGMAAAGAFTFEISPPGTNDLAKKLYSELASATLGMFAGIAADPPDYDYETVAQPVFEDIDQTGNPLLDGYFDAMMRAAAYGVASRIANERYQGAELDGDHESAFEQAQAASDFTMELIGQLRLLHLWADDVATFELEYTGSELSPGEKNLGTLPYYFDDLEFFGDSEWDDAKEYWDQVLADLDDIAANGISDEQRKELTDCDPALVGETGSCPITDEAIDAAIAAAQDAELMAYLHAIDPNLTIGELLQSQKSLYATVIEEYSAFANWMAHQAQEEYRQTDPPAPNRAPVATFTVSSSTGTAPLTVTFTGSATDPDGDALDLTWDIAGARHVDGVTSVTHTFTNPGEYWISLVATDPEGLWDQEIQKVTVYPPDATGTEENHAPVASFTPVTVDEEGPFEETFTATSTDPDNDTLTHTWYFGDGTSYTGDTVTKEFPAGYIMSVLLVSSDGRLTSQASGEVTSRKPASDPDPEPNTPPVAQFSAEPASGAAPLQVVFTSTSTDADGDSLTHTWHFGDGQIENGTGIVQHTYAFPGTYTVTMVVSDGQASRSTTQTVTVQPAAPPLQADFTVAHGYDALSALNGAQILATGVAQQSGASVTNLFLPTGYWRTPNNDTSEQTIYFKLAGDGRDILDRVVLTGVNAGTSTKEFSVALTQSANPFSGYTTVLDHSALQMQAGEQAFTFAQQRATYLRLTVHNNHGNTAYVRLDRITAPTVGRDGGLVSLDLGRPATATATTEYSSAYSAAKALIPGSSYWSSTSGSVTDQTLRVNLGGDGVHRIDRVALRGSTASASAQDFEVWVSETGDDGSWSHVLTGTLPQDAALHEFSFTPTDAASVELRLKNNHGATNYLYLYELRVLTTHGLNVALGSGVGAQIVDYSSVYASYDPANVLLPGSTSAWLGAPGQLTDQYVTALLRNGESYLIDRVVVTPGSYRPKNVEVQVSDDGENFTTVATQQLLNIIDDQSIVFEPTQARFVRLMLLDGYAATYLGVQRLRVFAVDRGGAAGVPFVDTSSGSSAITAWAWDFGDGATSSEQHPVHTFTSPGIYRISLTVTDANNDATTVTGSYTVPELPTIGISTTATAFNEMATIPLAASSSEPVASWDWDFGYTKPTSTTSSVTARFPDDGTYTVTLGGLSDEWIHLPSVTRDFTVLNVAPTVEAGSTQTAFAGEPATPLSNVSDPADSLICTWDWGDGSAVQVVEPCTTSTSRVPHVYALPGDYTATLTADDGDGGVTSDTVTLTALIRPAFWQITQASAIGDDLQVTARLMDARSGTPVPGQPVTLTPDGFAPVDAVTDDDGFAQATIDDAAAAEKVSAAFSGNALHQAASITRSVRAPKADIVFAVDESGSMAGVQAAVRENLRTIMQALGSDLDYELGVIGYAAGTVAHGGTDAHLHTALTADVSQAYRGVADLMAGSSSANPYDGIVTGLGFELPDNNPDNTIVDNGTMDFRPTAATCIVVISDAAITEAPNTTSKAASTHAEAALAQRGAILLSIISAGQSTIDAMGATPGLAGQTGGDWWPITTFVNDPSGVLNSLVAKCVTKAQTPDLAVSIGGPAGAVAGDTAATLTVTASNEAAIDTPSVVLTATLPNGMVFDSASDGGTFDSATRTVSWPAVDLAAGAHVTRTITTHADIGSLAPGEHDVEVTASVGYNGSLGAEADVPNNAAARTVTVQIPHRHDVGIAASTPAPAEAGDDVTYTITVTNNGTADATNVSVLQQVPDRLTVTEIDLPEGWISAFGGALVGPHPDGTTAGTWLHLVADSLADRALIEVTARLAAMQQPTVVADEGSLYSDLPTVVPAPADELSSPVCVAATEDGVEGNDCAAVRVPLRDITAAVTVRLSGGITYLLVSVATSASLEGMPVTMTWTTGDQTDSLTRTELTPGELHLVAWPGAVVDGDDQAIGWPGWRAIANTDRDADGALLDPATGERLTALQMAEMVRGDLILDLTLPIASWRAPSTVTFSVNPSVSFPIVYREVVPEAAAPVTTTPATPTAPTTPSSTVSTTTPTTSAPTTAVTSTATPTATPTTHTIIVEATTAESDDPLASTGVHGLAGTVGAGILLVLLGWLLILRTRRDPARR